MSLALLVKQLVGTAFDVIDDLAPAGTITPSGETSYDTDTGEVTDAAVPVDIEQIIETRFRARELDDSVNVATDAKFIIHSRDLSTTPTNGDLITKNDPSGTIEEEWNVVKVLGVPGNSIWMLHVRKH